MKMQPVTPIPEVPGIELSHRPRTPTSKHSVHSSAIDRAMKANPTLTREAAEEMAKAFGF